MDPINVFFLMFMSSLGPWHLKWGVFNEDSYQIAKMFLFALGYFRKSIQVTYLVLSPKGIRKFKVLLVFEANLRSELVATFDWISHKTYTGGFRRKFAKNRRKRQIVANYSIQMVQCTPGTFLEKDITIHPLVVAYNWKLKSILEPGEE